MKIFCIGRNYVAHAKELGNDVPDEPVIFMKPDTALLQTDEIFHYPSFTNDLHYECELVLKVCKEGKSIPKEKASEYVNEISLGIDFTARDVQDILKKKGLPWEKAKGFDSSAAIGKMVMLNESMFYGQHLFTFQKNGEVVQQGNSDLMLFNFSSIIANISNYFTLSVGDLIYTGTPEGVGKCGIGDKLEAFLGNEKLLSIEIQ